MELQQVLLPWRLKQALKQIIETNGFDAFSEGNGNYALEVLKLGNIEDLIPAILNDDFIDMNQKKELNRVLESDLDVIQSRLGFPGTLRLHEENGDYFIDYLFTEADIPKLERDLGVFPETQKVAADAEQPAFWDADATVDFKVEQGEPGLDPAFIINPEGTKLDLPAMPLEQYQELEPNMQIRVYKTLEDDLAHSAKVYLDFEVHFEDGEQRADGLMVPHYYATLKEWGYA